jgi:cell wall-associated NlpC family hydrolase
MVEQSMDLHRKPRRKSGLLFSRRFAATVLALVLFALVLEGVSGCGAVAPRFKASGRTAADQSSARKPAAPDTSGGIVQDVESEAPEAERVISGRRSFATEKNTAISNLDQAKLMREISKMMGVSYKLGGVDENGIDCSAYTLRVYKNAIGVSLPRSSAEQFQYGEAVEPSDLKFGDLVFFNTTGSTASHVGIYLGDDLFAHASVSLGVTISSLESFFYKKRYEGARRIVQ